MMEFKPVIFRIGEEEYGVDITVVRGIENMLPIVKVPNAGRHIKGIINLRGDVIPVFSLRSKFHLPEVATTDNTKLIIAQTERFRLALEVDMVDEIQNISEEMVHPAPLIIKGKETNYVDKVININGKLVVIVNAENLLTDDEKKEIEEILNQE